MFLWTSESEERNKLSAKYEPLQPFLFLSFLKYAHAECVFDIGSNVGLYSLISTLAPSVNKVLSFEPDVTAHINLNANVSLNSLERTIETFKVAISDANGLVRLGTHEPMSGINGVLDTSIHDKSLFAEIQEVNSIKLDNFVDYSDKVLALKIDVEGHELSVIKGATNLLKAAACIIQIEHYIGEAIDRKLNELGYYCFFSAGHDFYYTNIRNFFDKEFLKRGISHAIAWMVSVNSNKLPNLGTIRDCLNCQVEAGDDFLVVKADLKGSFFKEPEYAFYLLEDKKKLQQRWYTESNTTTFSISRSDNPTEIKAFVREKNFTDKKSIYSFSLTRENGAFTPSSSVLDSVSGSKGLPSKLSKPYDVLFDSADLDLSQLILDIKNECSCVLLSFGIFSSNLQLLKSEGFFQTTKARLYIYTAKPSLSASKVNSTISMYNTQNVVCSFSLDNLDELFSKGILKKGETAYLIITDIFITLFFSSISLNDKLESLLSKVSRLYIEALINDTYRTKLLHLCEVHEVALTWLKPNSMKVTDSDEEALRPLQKLNFELDSKEPKKFDFGV